MPIPAHACISVISEPPSPPIIRNVTRPSEILNHDGSPLHLQVGQTFEFRLPLVQSDDEWDVSIAGTPADSPFIISGKKSAIDDDGTRRKGVVLKGASKGDAILIFKYASEKPTGKRKNSEMSMVHVMVEPIHSFAAPREPRPLRLGESDAGRKSYVTYGEDVIVLLQNPEGETGEWRLVDKSESGTLSASEHLKKTAALASEQDKSMLFVVDSKTIKGQLNFEFVRKNSDNLMVNIFRSKVAKSISFDIEVRPAPLC